MTFRAEVERLFAWHGWQNRSHVCVLGSWESKRSRRRSRLSESAEVVRREAAAAWTNFAVRGHGGGASPSFKAFAGEIRFMTLSSELALPYCDALELHGFGGEMKHSMVAAFSLALGAWLAFSPGRAEACTGPFLSLIHISEPTRPY